MKLDGFPSPCGDELFQMAGCNSSEENGFRPLAGMNCFKNILSEHLG